MPKNEHDKLRAYANNPNLSTFHKKFGGCRMLDPATLKGEHIFATDPEMGMNSAEPMKVARAAFNAMLDRYKYAIPFTDEERADLMPLDITGRKTNNWSVNWGKMTSPVMIFEAGLLKLNGSWLMFDNDADVAEAVRLEIPIASMRA